jgi:hypothetical protein
MSECFQFIRVIADLLAFRANIHGTSRLFLMAPLA